jgi:hypothetical protein
MRLMRARMTRGTAVVMGVTSRPVRAWLRTAAGGCTRQTNHSEKLPPSVKACVAAEEAPTLGWEC